jgi:hypothetical protein
VLFVAVVEFTIEPSIVRLHEAVVKMGSVSLKLKFNEVEEVLRPLIGELRTTEGSAVAMVKFLVALVLLRLAAFVQETFQLWVPAPRPE